MPELSPAAQAILTAVTQSQYCLDPSDIPNEAARMASIVADALEALADQSEAVHIVTGPGFSEFDVVLRVSDILAIAAELKAHDSND